MPLDASYQWKDGNPPNTSNAGPTVVTVVVQYKDGSTDEIEIPIYIQDVNDDNQLYEPVAEKDKSITSGTSLPNPKDMIKNRDDMPAGTQYQWTGTLPDTATTGTKIGQIEVTYPDGTQDTIYVSITVNEPTIEPEVQPVYVDKNGNLPDAKDAIKNMDDLPTDTTADWVNKGDIDTAKDGKQNTNVKVTYPDSSEKNVNVEVYVNPNSESYQPDTSNLNTKKGVVPDAKDAIKNMDKLPQGTKVEWIIKPNVDNSGTSIGKVKVIYPDTTVDEVFVEITVATEGASAPEVKQVSTKKNTLPSPEDLIIDTTSLPQGTKITYQSQPNITSAGTKTGSILVVYPNGKAYIIPITLQVTETTTSGGGGGSKRDNNIIKRKKELSPKDNLRKNMPIENMSISQWAEKYSHQGAQAHIGYIVGFTDGTIRPDKNLTRAEAATMVARLENLALDNFSLPRFKDTLSPQWYDNSINAVSKAGIMNGDDKGNFNRSDLITRGEFAQVIVNTDHRNNHGISPFIDISGHWAENSINKAYFNKRIVGYEDNTFRPDNHITRAEAVAILNRAYNRVTDDIALIDTNTNRLNRFSDLYSGNWYYYEMLEASNDHGLVRRGDEDTLNRENEDWLYINK